MQLSTTVVNGYLRYIASQVDINVHMHLSCAHGLRMTRIDDIFPTKLKQPQSIQLHHYCKATSIEWKKEIFRVRQPDHVPKQIPTQKTQPTPHLNLSC